MTKFATMVPLPSGFGASEVVAFVRSTCAELMRPTRSHAGSGTMCLDPPSLVHDAYLHFNKQHAIAPKRKIFPRSAPQANHAVVVDFMRAPRALKRGGGCGGAMIPLTPDIEGTVVGKDSTNPRNDALSALNEIDACSHPVVERRYFSGMAEEKIARLREVTVATVKRDWRKDRAFLFDTIGKPVQ